MISIVIPNYNGEGLLKKNFPKLLEILSKTKMEWEIVVVDDASTDNSKGVIVELARLENNKIKTIFKEKNEGFASTTDLGIRQVGGEVVFVMKTDLLPKSPDYFRLMLEHFKNANVFAVSGAMETVENGKKEIRGQGIIYFEKGFFLHKRRDLHELGTNHHEHQISYWADGGASAFNKDLYLKIGGFDPLFNPFYWEDVDLGYRAWKAGYEIHFEPKALLEHTHTEGVIRKSYTEKQIKLISLRNQFIFVWKNADLGNLWEYLKWETYHHLVSLKNRDSSFIRAYWLAMVRLPKIIQRRVDQKRINRLTDEEVLSFFHKKDPDKR